MFAKIVQVNGITKEIRSFLFYSWTQPILFKDSANERNDKTKYAVFVFHSRVQPILFKDSASEWNNKRNTQFLFFEYVAQGLHRRYGRENTKHYTLNTTHSLTQRFIWFMLIQHLPITFLPFYLSKISCRFEILVFV